MNHVRLRPIRSGALVIATVTLAAGAAPSPAVALSPGKMVCGVAGLISGVAGRACNVVTHAGKLVNVGKKLLTGHVGSAVGTLTGGGTAGGGSSASTAIGLAAIGAWVLGGARSALHETANVLSQTTSPQLGSTWFSATYWHTAGIAAVLTLPFLFAAGVQALMRSDLAMLARAALGYLPLSLLAVSIAAPLTMLLLAASDQMSAVVSSAAGHASGRFLDHASRFIGALTLLSRSPFLAFLVGLLTASAALVLWLELLMREAAVYVIVLMLPLVFSAFVWPARRMWAIRSVELLVALILSKFAMVAVLSLGGAALSHSSYHNITGSLAGVVLLLMGAFAPWALLRLVPLTEVASGAAGSLHAETRLRERLLTADAREESAEDKLSDLSAVTAGMRRQAQEARAVDGARNGNGARAAADRPAEPAAVPGGGAGAGGSIGGFAGEPRGGDELNGNGTIGTAGTVGTVGTVGGPGRGDGGAASGGGGGAVAGAGAGSGDALAGAGAAGGAGRRAGAAGGGGAVAGSSAVPPAGASTPGERIPLSARWQAEWWTGPSLALGIDECAPQPPSPSENPAEASGHPTAGSPTDASAGNARQPTADDPDPLPPGQEPGEGRL